MKGVKDVEEIVAVDRNSYGEIISFKTSSGRVISYRKAMQEIQEGIIAGVQIEQSDSEQISPVIKAISEDPYFDHYPPIY